MAVTKIKPIRKTIEKSIAYITNPGKTENCLFVSSEHCIPETAAVEFQFLLDKAQAGGNTIGRHLIQSFAPGEVTPEQAHEIGKKLAAEILGGEYAYVLATHVDREHIHNHFVWCAVNMVTHNRYRSNKASYHKIQDASDRLCAEYSLSVVTEKSGRRGKEYTEYQADKFGTSWKTLLRRTIDAAVGSSATFDSFLAFMVEAGYEIKRGKYISFRATGQERFTRAKTIGDNYTEERLRERITEPKRVWTPRFVKPSIERIIGSNSKTESSPGYRHWAALHDLHAMVDTHNYLSERHDLSIAEFETHYADCIARRSSAQAAFNEAAKQIAADKGYGVTEKLKQHNALRTRYAKEMAALSTEIAEMDRVRANLIATHGEQFYNKNAHKRREMEL